LHARSIIINLIMQEVPVRSSMKKAYTWEFIAAGLVVLIGFSVASAQKTWATLDAPPAGVAPAGDVLRPGHLGRMIGNVELMIHFYHDLIGLGLLGPRGGPRPFGSKETGPALLEFVQLGQGVPNPMDARNRAVILPIPGTSTTKGSEMSIEAIEIKNIESRPYRPSMSDPGASHIKLFVRNLDKILAVLKDELVPVITAGKEPVILSGYPGMTGKIRAVFVRDPDGYPVGLFELTPPPASNAPQIAIFLEQASPWSWMIWKPPAAGFSTWSAPILNSG
jgi:catechol 2,3-dioxygenase-like lactoylglutathione lyase family enzyme